MGLDTLWAIFSQTHLLTQDIHILRQKCGVIFIVHNRNSPLMFSVSAASVFFLIKATTLHTYTLAGFDLKTHISAGRDDTTT
jgi:hypothetical protein